MPTADKNKEAKDLSRTSQSEQPPTKQSKLDEARARAENQPLDRNEGELGKLPTHNPSDKALSQVQQLPAVTDGVERTYRVKVGVHNEAVVEYNEDGTVRSSRTVVYGPGQPAGAVFTTKIDILKKVDPSGEKFELIGGGTKGEHTSTTPRGFQEAKEEEERKRKAEQEAKEKEEAQRR